MTAALQTTCTKPAHSRGNVTKVCQQTHPLSETGALLSLSIHHSASVLQLMGCKLSSAAKLKETSLQMKQLTKDSAHIPAARCEETISQKSPILLAYCLPLLPLEDIFCHKVIMKTNISPSPDAQVLFLWEISRINLK